MKQHLSLLFTFFSIWAIAQVPGDPSYNSRSSETIDTLARRIIAQATADTVLHLSLDSIRTEFNAAVDSLHQDYRRSVAHVNEETKKLNQAIDSLERQRLPTGKYKKKLRKLSDTKRRFEAEFDAKLNTFKAKTADKLNALDLPPEYKKPLQKLTQQINNVTLDGDIIKLPELNIPGHDLPTTNVQSLDPLRKGTDIPELPNVQPPTEVGEVTQQLQEYEGQLAKIPNADITNPETLQKTIETQASKVEGIDELQKQSGVIDAHQSKLDDLSDPEKGKKKAAELAKKAAVDHFAGKEEQLKTAMEKIAKYKQKYSSVSSIKDLPKRPPNAMKGKHLIERLTPGLYFQYQQKNFYLLDVNPYIGYKISGRFTAGLGWNHRFAYDKDRRILNARSRIFGPRGYLDFKLGKGFSVHLEGESMNTFVPSTLVGNLDTGHREWVWSFMTGLKKEYKIYKNLRGTAVIQYNWLNRYYKAPYVDRLNSRIGFEYVLRKRAGKK